MIDRSWLSRASSEWSSLVCTFRSDDCQWPGSPSTLEPDENATCPHADYTLPRRWSRRRKLARTALASLLLLLPLSSECPAATATGKTTTTATCNYILDVKKWVYRIDPDVEDFQLHIAYDPNEATFRASKKS